MAIDTLVKFKRARVEAWPRDRIEALSTLEVRQLGANAARLGEPELAALCNEVLDGRPHGHPSVRKVAAKGGARRLVPRADALGQRGVTLRSRVWSCGGVKQSDAMVVFALRAEDVQAADGASQYLLWAPNADGSRPWSDTPAGQERLEHCRLAAEGGTAEGLLVHGERGADPHTVLTLRIEKRGEEYWASWGGGARAAI
jgi:hypothetical protein